MKIHRQLDAARRAQGLTYDELRARAALQISIASMSRKLRGKKPLRDKEIDRLARALGIEVVVERTTVTLGAAA